VQIMGGLINLPIWEIQKVKTKDELK